MSRRVIAGVLSAILFASDSLAQSSSEEQGDQGEYDEEDAESFAASPPVGTAAAMPEQAGMLRIPGGRLAYRVQDPKVPVREVVVRPFWLDRTEVDVAAYQACVASAACPAPPRSSPYCTFALGDPALPISCVKHASAVTFCRQRGARLPTEVEWEFAATGNSPHSFPWGATRPRCELAATLRSDKTAKSCSGARPARVGSHPLGKSPFGVEDLAGNVEEWTADYYSEPMPAAPPQSGASFVLRGGSWLLGPSYAKTTARSAGSSMEAGPGVGFRCAKGA